MEQQSHVCLPGTWRDCTGQIPNGHMFCVQCVLLVEMPSEEGAFNLLRQILKVGTVRGLTLR